MSKTIAILRQNGRRAEISRTPFPRDAYEVVMTSGKIEMGREICDDEDDARAVAEEFVDGRLTNVEIVVRIMENSTNALTQALVIQAISEFSKQVLAADLPEGGWVSPAAWRDAAKQAQDMLEMHMSVRAGTA